MADWNLALIDVASAWVVVALPRLAQAKLLASSGRYPAEAMRALAIDERLSVDPVKHTSALGTLLVPAITSLASLPVIAWGKPIESASPGLPRLARRIWLAPILVYLAQALLFGALMAVLSQVYLAGAPVAARAGQLCLRLAMLNVLALPLLDSGLALSVGLKRPLKPAWIPALLTLVALSVLWTTGALRAIDQEAQLAFFQLSRLFV